jgi:antitoxin ParD1/3/4
MNMSLTPELEAFIQEKSKTSRYHSASEVVQEGLRLLECRDEVRRLRPDEMRKRIAAELASLDRLRAIPGDWAFEELEAGLDIGLQKSR